MDKQTWLHILEWSVAIAALVFLVWKLATYEDYAALGECLRAMGWQEYAALALTIALMPVNMAIEAWRWMTLMNEGVGLKDEGMSGLVDESRESRVESQEKLSFIEAQRQVYYSKLAGLITPWRLGEYPARALLLENESRESRVKSQETWARVLSMGAVGSATMTMAIVIAGIGGLAFSPSVFTWLGGSYLYSLAIVVAGLVLLFAFMPKMLKRWATVRQELLLRSLGQSLIRLVCWCIQLGLVLWALGGLEGEWMSGLVAKTPVYYLLVTITPNVPVVEAGVRGAWAIAVFGTMNAALAGVLLWAINTLLPCLFALGITARRKEPAERA